MLLRFICCEIFYREACRLIADCPNTVEVEFLPKGLHDLGAEKMSARLQERIDAIPEGACDAVLMGYCLCNNGVVSLSSTRTRLVIPRAHDCITVLMGSRAKYQDYFSAHPGTCYRSTGWIEREDPDGANDVTIQAKLGLFQQFEELVAKYGEDNANYIMETLGDPTAHYNRVTFISVGLDCEPVFRERARAEAEEKGWEFDDVPGSLEILRKLLWGDWDDDFLILEPGQSIVATHGADIIKAAGQE